MPIFPPASVNPENDEDIKLRGKRSPKIRPASWDASLIYNSEKEGGKSTKPVGKDEGGKQFNRKENGRLPIRKKPYQMEEGENEQMGVQESEGEGV